MNIFVFDIETVPDVAGGRRLYDLVDLSDHEVAQAMFKIRRQETGGAEFLRLPLQRIVAISVVLCSHQQLKVWSLGELQASEGEIIARFFAGVEKYRPTLVSWNGAGFDLPVLHYRALLHGIAAPVYWETGDNEQAFRWNNYLSRYHYRHLDLMDVLSGYQARASAPLDDIATLLGLPGKIGMNGALVWDYFQKKDIAAIRNYCETDVLNTYLVYLRFELMRGKLTQENYQRSCTQLAHYLTTADKSHFNEFLAAWQAKVTSNDDTIN